MMLGSDRIIQENGLPSINKGKNKAVVTKTQIKDASRKYDQFVNVPYRHRGGRIKKINAWYLNTLMVYL
jgi:hypothetical protein